MKKTNKITAVLVAGMVAAGTASASLVTASASNPATGNSSAKTASSASAKTVANASITVKPQVYTAKALKPAVTVKVGDSTLVAGRDYSLAYSNNVKVGKATVTVKGTNDYAGQKSVSFNILPRKPIVSQAALSGDSVKLSWNKVAYATSYTVYVKTSDDKDYKEAGETKDTSYTAEGNYNDGNTYQFIVKATADVNGNNYSSAFSDVKEVSNNTSDLKKNTETAKKIQAVFNEDIKGSFTTSDRRPGKALFVSDGKVWKEAGTDMTFNPENYWNRYENATPILKTVAYDEVAIAKAVPPAKINGRAVAYVESDGNEVTFAAFASGTDNFGSKVVDDKTYSVNEAHFSIGTTNGFKSVVEAESYNEDEPVNS
jgi:hypothetical protein